MNKIDYEELVEKLEADGFIKRKDKEVVPQTYFKQAIEHMSQKYSDNDSDAIHGGWGTAWDQVRKLVLWSYGARTVSWMKKEQQQEANDKAIALIDILFE